MMAVSIALRVCLIAASLFTAFWAVRLVNGYNLGVAEFLSEPREVGPEFVDKYFAPYWPKLIVPTAAAAALAGLLALMPARKWTMITIGMACVATGLFAIHHPPYDYFHDLGHSLFNECSPVAWDRHRLVLAAPIVLATVMPTVLTYAKHKTANPQDAAPNHLTRSESSFHRD